eukprot:CAMPEP_0171524020 /NCGR_PEP_ID=MMETSP0959-20130129/8791_1 /TAXON_ID=87120 /ORGANISM="Aurantiochytrium limacinum, Strain ATCCMYA-1381" /LENGTH=480 /DNA_ID=CAMNT_0012064657 /DNA_START=36 /DNA_END=1478 /DNA_ORIENTATION=+
MTQNRIAKSFAAARSIEPRRLNPSRCTKASQLEFDSQKLNLSLVRGLKLNCTKQNRHWHRAHLHRTLTTEVVKMDVDVVALVDHELEELVRKGDIELLDIASGPCTNGVNRSNDQSIDGGEEAPDSASGQDRESNLLLQHIEPASVDLPVGRECYLVRDKVLPHRQSIRALVQAENSDLVLERKDVDPAQGVLLLKGQTYLFPCAKLDLEEGLNGSLSPKSSIGRVDLMVRGIFDGCGLYDTVEGSGELWMEVSPRSFNVRVHAHQPLSQLMIFRKQTPCEDAPLSPTSLSRNILCYDAKGEAISFPQVHRGALVLSLNLTAERPDGVLGFEAVPTSAVIDLGSLRSHDAERYFRPIPASSAVTLEKDKFYILATKERVSIPNHLSAEMVPFSSRVGELRAHYAGFFDPGFGYGHDGSIKGTVGVLEVRPHETVTVYDGQPICLMEFFNNSSLPARPYGHPEKSNNYQAQQGPKLAKYFK